VVLVGLPWPLVPVEDLRPLMGSPS